MTWLKESRRQLDNSSRPPIHVTPPNVYSSWCDSALPYIVGVAIAHYVMRHHGIVSHDTSFRQKNGIGCLKSAALVLGYLHWLACCRRYQKRAAISTTGLSDFYTCSILAISCYKHMHSKPLYGIQSIHIDASPHPVSTPGESTSKLHGSDVKPP